MKKKEWLIVLGGVAIGTLIGVLVMADLQRRQVRVAYNHWNKLNVILDEAALNYVDTINIQKVTDAAVSAALGSLDPHSVYLEPKVLKEEDEKLAGSFDGVGIQFNVPNDTAVVLSVVHGGPSEKAGIIAGDRILKVDERDIAGTKTPQDTMVHLMRGLRGTKVVLTIGRGSRRIPFEITRDKIPETSIGASFMVNDSTGYIHLTRFARNTHLEFFTESHRLCEEGMSKLILDLRDNTGGFFDQACNIANEFLPDKSLIVYMQGAHRRREDVHSNGKGTLQDIKLSVLINDGSASASEILAGAIQDNDRGEIIGRRSFGKGLIQEPIYFSDGSGIRLTVARYYTPSGRCIQKPYTENYNFEFYERYQSGELSSADSIKVDSTQVFHTLNGRTVYGGGGIIPDKYVPLSNEKGSDFFVKCRQNAVEVRFAAYFQNKYSDALQNVGNIKELESFFRSYDVEKQFLSYAASLGFKPKAGEWEASRHYMFPQVKALVGRYSKLGEEAYYRYVMPVDDIIMAAL